MSNPFSSGPTTPPRPKRSIPTHHARSQSTTHTGPQPHQGPGPGPTSIPPPHDFDLDLTLNPDPNSPLTPTSFSPSKARQQAQATHQQTQIRTWLETLIPPSTPAHPLLTRWQAAQSRLSTTHPELAAEITAWLQAAMYTAQAADELRRLQFEAAREELGRLREWSEGAGAGYVAEGLGRVYAALTGEGRGAVDALAASAVLLGHVPAWVPGVAGGMAVGESLVVELGSAVVAHTVGVQSTQTTVEELESLHGVLRRQLEQLQLQMNDFQREKMVADADAEAMRSQTAQWNRETKQILVKIKEYKDRVAALERSRPVNRLNFRPGEQTIMAEDVVHLQERVNEKRETVKRLEERVGIFNKLPPDLEASRNEVKRARGELERLKGRREELFEILTRQR